MIDLSESIWGASNPVSFRARIFGVCQPGSKALSLIPSSAMRMLELIRAKAEKADLARRLEPASGASPARKLRHRQNADAATIAGFWERLHEVEPVSAETEAILADPSSIERAQVYSPNIENFIGTAKMPIGLVGPMRVNGLNAEGDYFVPLATTEAALVASYGRGADVTAKAGGISSAVIFEGVLRTPAFVFRNMYESGVFVNWVANNCDRLKAAAESTTRYGKLVSVEPFIDSDTVFLICRFTTGDAAGQNMVTVATQALCMFVEANTPVQPLHWFIEANFSGDKKASYLGMHTGRGRKVTASVEVPFEIIRRNLRADPQKLLAYGRVAGLGAVLSGQLGAQAHYANGLAALYIATGQDAACVSESAVGFTRMEERDNALFFSVTMPNILVGTVGGGTSLPSQAACLDILGLRGSGNAPALAEVTAALCLCGEISIIAAIASGHFTHAHEKLARLR